MFVTSLTYLSNIYLFNLCKHPKKLNIREIHLLGHNIQKKIHSCVIIFSILLNLKF